MFTIKKILLLCITINTLSSAYNTKDPSNMIDIMYVYTTNAKLRSGGKVKIEENIRTAFNRINNAFKNSKMQLRANLVAMKEISYPYHTSSQTTLERLVNKNDGYMDNVHQLRDKYSADFVQLVVASGEHGLGYTMFNVDSRAEAYAFALIRYDHMNGASVHELGHNMGIQHHNTNGGSQYYARGYADGTYRTIQGVWNGKQINYWSSPNLFYKGHRLGDSIHDAKRTILENAAILSNFRSRTAKVLPFVTRFYQTILGRQGETAGVDYWTSSLVNGSRTGADIARGFIFSQEFINKNTDNVTFLTILYRAFFNRNPDSGGLNYWLYRLDQGYSRYSVLNGFLYSQEFKNLTAIYNIKPY